MSNTLSLKDRKRIYTDEMTSELQKKVTKIEGLMSQVAKACLAKYYAICVEIEQISNDKDKYGVTGLEQLANYLNIGVRTLNKRIQIARCFDKATVASMANETNAVGITTGVYVLEETASLPNEKIRGEYYKIWKDEGLSRDGLREAIAEYRAPSHDAPADLGDDEKPAVSAKSVVKRIVTQMQKLAAELDELAELDTDELDTEDAKTLDLLHAAGTASEKLRARLETAAGLWSSSDVIEGSAVVVETLSADSTSAKGSEAVPAVVEELADPDPTAALASASPKETGVDMDAFFQSDSESPQLDGDATLAAVLDSVGGKGETPKSKPKSSAKKKAAGKKAPAKKAAGKRAPAKKAPAKKAPAKKATGKKAPAKKAETGSPPAPVEAVSPSATTGGVLKKKPAAGPAKNRRRGG